MKLKFDGIPDEKRPDGQPRHHVTIFGNPEIDKQRDGSGARGPILLHHGAVIEAGDLGDGSERSRIVQSCIDQGLCHEVKEETDHAD